MIHIAGGLYRERCLLPSWNEMYGSGGRAASALAKLDKRVTLHAFVSRRDVSDSRIVAGANRFKLVSHPISQTPRFYYLHPVAGPEISNRLPDERLGQFSIKKPNVLRYGMLEGSCIVTAEWAVYDPQSVTAPQLFGSNGSKAHHLAYVLNFQEGRVLTGQERPDAIAGWLQEHEDAKVVVLKNGPYGAYVFSNSKVASVPAYRTESAFTIGSGDVFAAIFAYYWMERTKSPKTAALLASRATAIYCDTQNLPIYAPDIETRSFRYPPITPSRAKAAKAPLVYLAAPYFTSGEKMLVEELRNGLMSLGLRVFSPFHDVGLGSSAVVVRRDLTGLKRSDVVLAVLDTADPGTLYEVGYARSIGTPVIALRECAWRNEFKMVEGSGCKMVEDIGTALYTAVWEAIT